MVIMGHKVLNTRRCKYSGDKLYHEAKRPDTVRNKTGHPALNILQEIVNGERGFDLGK